MEVVKIESKLNLNEKEESEQNDKVRKDTERPTDLILNFNIVYERNIGEKVWSLLVKMIIFNKIIIWINKTIDRYFILIIQILILFDKSLSN